MQYSVLDKMIVSKCQLYLRHSGSRRYAYLNFSSSLHGKLRLIKRRKESAAFGRTQTEFRA